MIIVKLEQLSTNKIKTHKPSKCNVCIYDSNISTAI